MSETTRALTVALIAAVSGLGGVLLNMSYNKALEQQKLAQEEAKRKEDKQQEEIKRQKDMLQSLVQMQEPEEKLMATIWAWKRAGLFTDPAILKAVNDMETAYQAKKQKEAAAEAERLAMLDKATKKANDAWAALNAKQEEMRREEEAKKAAEAAAAKRAQEEERKRQLALAKTPREHFGDLTHSGGLR